MKTAEEILEHVKQYVKECYEDTRIMCYSDTVIINRRIDQAIELINAAQARPWVSVSERLPENLNAVLAYYNFGEHEKISKGFYDAKGFWIILELGGAMTTQNVTHWQPLPDSPTKTKEI